MIKDEPIDHEIVVDSKQHDFYFRLPDKLKNDLDDIKKRLDAKEKPAEKKDKDETADSNKNTPPDKSEEK